MRDRVQGRTPSSIEEISATQAALLERGLEEFEVDEVLAQDIVFTGEDCGFVVLVNVTMTLSLGEVQCQLK